MTNIERSKEMPTVGSPEMSAWRPRESGVSVSELLPKLKLRNIEKATYAPDFLVKIKTIWIGRIYKNHIKKVIIFRRLINWGWRTLYPLYANTIAAHLGSRATKRWRRLVKLGVHVQTLGLPTTKVFDAAKVETPVPTVIPDRDQTYLVPPHDHYVFPPVYVAELSNSLVYGGTNLVFAQDAVICHDLYDFERDYTSEELHGRHLIDVKRMRMRLLRHDATPDRVAVAATFVDACAHNFAHWMTEVLPRIAAFCSVEQFANVPLIINEGLHDNIMESLGLIIDSEREVISLPVGRGILVDRLYVTSVAGYVPFERRNEKLAGHSHGLFCPPAFKLLRERFLLLAERLPSQNFPEKVYFRRASASRNVSNIAELERILLEMGFSFIDPGELSFLQQAAIASNASEVIASTGAALASMLFGRQGARVGIMMAKHKEMIYRYWVNMLFPLGVVPYYVLGENIGERNAGLHADFRIRPEHVYQLLNEWCIL